MQPIPGNEAIPIMQTKTRILTALLSLCCLAFLSWQSLAAPWPRFRGPNGTGTVADKQVPIHWTEASGVLWKKALPGTGNSSPIVWGERLFVESASKDGKERLLLCLNVQEGNILWTRSV